jgi:hypothetical protein
MNNAPNCWSRLAEADAVIGTPHQPSDADGQRLAPEPDQPRLEP